jgi:putative transposase
VGVFEPPLSIKGRYAVTQDNIVKFAEPGTFKDPLTEVLRSGARKLLAQAIEAEISDFLDRNSGFLIEEGQQRLVRHGHLPEREIMTGIGPVGVRAPGFATVSARARRASASRRRFCRPMHADRRASRC